MSTPDAEVWRRVEREEAQRAAATKWPRVTFFAWVLAYSVYTLFLDQHLPEPVDVVAGLILLAIGVSAGIWMYRTLRRT